MDKNSSAPAVTLVAIVGLSYCLNVALFLVHLI